MAEEEFARQIQRLRGNNVTIEEMENRAEQFRTRLLTQPDTPPLHSSPGLPYHPITPTGHLSRRNQGAPSFGGVVAANPRTPSLGLQLGPDAPETSQTRGVSVPFGSHPDRLRFAFANVNEIDPSLEKDDRTLEQKQQDQSKAELLPPWERYRLYHPIADYPLPLESWQNLLSKETLQGLPLTRTPTRDDSMLDSWKGEVRKRKRTEPSQSNHLELDEMSGYQQAIVDCFGAYRPVSYFEELGGLVGEQDQPKRPHQDILHQLGDPDSPQNNTEFEKTALVSPWIGRLTPEMYNSVESAFGKEEMQVVADLSEVYVVKDTNKRRKLEEKESKPAGFRGTRFYRIMEATIKFLFSKNT